MAPLPAWYPIKYMELQGRLTSLRPYDQIDALIDELNDIWVRMTVMDRAGLDPPPLKVSKPQA